MRLPPDLPPLAEAEKRRIRRGHSHQYRGHSTNTGHFYQQPLSKQSHDYLSYNPRGGKDAHLQRKQPSLFSYPLFSRGRSWRRQLVDHLVPPSSQPKTEHHG